MESANRKFVSAAPGRGNLQCCTLYYADRACRQTPVIFSVPIQIVARDEWFDYYEVILKSPINESVTILNYDGSDKCYVTVIFARHHADDRSEYFQLPFNHRATLSIFRHGLKMP